MGGRYRSACGKSGRVFGVGRMRARTVGSWFLEGGGSASIAVWGVVCHRRGV